MPTCRGDIQLLIQAEETDAAGSGETIKSHIGHVVLDSGWEAAVAAQLEASPLVQSYARNDHLDLAIPHDYLGQQHRYYPDFVIRLTNGIRLLLEVKGQETDQDRQKAQAARRWCEAVNAWGQLGTWRSETCKEPETLIDLLAICG